MIRTKTETTAATTSPTGAAVRAVPAAVRLSIAVWSSAVGAGVAESVLRLALPDPPTPGELAVRLTIYTVVVALVLALATGRDVVRWVLALVLGGVGTASLVSEPLSWWLAGGSVAEFLTSANAITLGIVVVRAVHILAVAVAMILMFRPQANTFFRESSCRRPRLISAEPTTYPTVPDAALASLRQGDQLDDRSGRGATDNGRTARRPRRDPR